MIIINPIIANKQYLIDLIITVVELLSVLKKSN